MNQERGKLKKKLFAYQKYVDDEILRIKTDSTKPYADLRVLYAKLDVWEKVASMVDDLIETCKSRNKF